MDVDVLRETRALLTEQRTISLATVDAGGMPHACNLQVAVGEATQLFFLSSPKAAHSEHLRGNGRAAVTAYHHQDDAPELLRGFQMYAQAELVERESLAWPAAWACYIDRFPFVETDPAIRQVASSQLLFVLQPTWIRWIDNRVSFGHRTEWGMED